VENATSVVLAVSKSRAKSYPDNKVEKTREPQKGLDYGYDLKAAKSDLASF